MSIFLRIQLEKIYMETLTKLHSFYHRLIQNLFQYKTHPPTFQATEGLIKMYAKYFLKILTASPYAMHLKMVHNIIAISSTKLLYKTVCHDVIFHCDVIWPVVHLGTFLYSSVKFPRVSLTSLSRTGHRPGIGRTI